MDADTYPNPAVQQVLTEHLIPLRVAHDQDPLASRYTVNATPLLILVNDKGQEIHRIQGVHPPNQFIPAVLLGLAKIHLQAGHYAQSQEYLGQIFSRYPKSQAVPEGLLLQGQNLHRQTGDPSHLRTAYETLHRDYPDSPWTWEASPYRLL
jgi:TolA-binding protein